ncbi:S-layer homology domain [Arabidopsis suecica]|uniref:S-layer homology domain n=1 Tax=Arabidopsis suecica TaxID=45249 RepID=A0A8T2DMZ9_ARASU|nr:S-layer homology domain [Arabidopsis suecica]
MASTMATWTPSSLQLRIALNHGIFKAPERAKMTKLSRRLRISCVAQNAEPGRDSGESNGSDRFRGWADSGDDENNSRGGDWFKGTLLSGVAGMVLFVGLTYAALSSKRNVLRPKVEVMVTTVTKSSIDQISTDENEGNIVTSQDNQESYRDSQVLSPDEIDVASKSTSTRKDNEEAEKASVSSAERYTSSTELDGVDTHTSQIPNEKQKARRYTGIPAPSTVPQVDSLKPIFPTVVDPVQSQMFAALQALKVIESDALPYDLCTRREFARWVVSASNTLSRNSASKVYPAMYIENVTELAFDDITPEDPDFPFIQGLAEAGLISSKLSNNNMPSSESSRVTFSPESPLTRQDLLSWKMALEFRQLPEADSKKLYQLSGFLDIDKINPEAWPALIADLSAGEHGITALSFGRTRLFQPSKAVTKAQTAVSLAIGDAFEVVGEELARIEAEAMAENVVCAHNELVAQVEKDINASFEKELLREKEIVDAVEKLAEEAKSELARLRVEKEEETLALERERTSIETEMEALARIRNELEEQLQSLASNKAEMSYEKERFDRLQKQVEDENQEILRLQNELEVERNALSIARNWAKDEARRAREQAKVLEEARGRWEKYGLKVIVDSELHEQTTKTESTWLNAGKQNHVEGTMKRAGNLIAKLKKMAKDVGEKSREVIYLIIEKISLLISALKQQVHGMENKAKDLKIKTKSKAEEVWRQTSLRADEIRNISIVKAKETVEEFKDRVGKLGEKFKSK